MTRNFEDYLGKHPVLYGRDLVRGLDIKEPPVSEFKVADYLGYKIREVYKEDLAEWPGMEDIFRVACAHLFPQEDVILINGELPPLKKRTCGFHETGHGAIPWHGRLNYACSEYAIEPVLHKLIERQAFLCGAAIQMPHHLFVPDALDLSLSIDSIKKLANRYVASLETTAIHYAQTSRRICAIVVIEPWEVEESATTIPDHESPNQLAFPYRRLHTLSESGKPPMPPPPLRVKYCVRSHRFPRYIFPGTGIAEENPIFKAWNTGIALQEEIPASVFGFWTKEVYHGDIFPLGNTGMVMALLWLPDHQLMLDYGREVVV